MVHLGQFIICSFRLKTDQTDHIMLTDKNLAEQEEQWMDSVDATDWPNEVDCEHICDKKSRTGMYKHILGWDGKG